MCDIENKLRYSTWVSEFEDYGPQNGAGKEKHAKLDEIIQERKQECYFG